MTVQFASTEDSIQAHLTIVFAALAISRHPHKTTGVSVRRIVQALRPLRDVTISIDGHELTAATPPAGEAADILNKLNSTPGHWVTRSRFDRPGTSNGPTEAINGRVASGKVVYGLR